MIRRHAPSRVEREFVRPSLPESPRGRKRSNDRTARNGIAWRFRAGVVWRDVPERYGSRAKLPLDAGRLETGT
ncbi:hypothetical protein GCM10010405_50020 [Streptomyces macrosporus]|uniref:Insertion element IS402-like domain-containing protein n=1 Tax=Streptomyces macrosporus TaxID=44032 RepID=A0ABP5XTG1_9ACTN